MTLLRETGLEDPRLQLPGKFLTALECSVLRRPSASPCADFGINLCPAGFLFFSPSTHGRTCGAQTSSPSQLQHTHTFLIYPKPCSSSKIFNSVCTVSVLPGLGQFSQGIEDARIWKTGFPVTTSEHNHLVLGVGSHSRASPAMSCSI